VKPIMTFWELERARAWHLDGPWPEATRNDFSVERLLDSLDYWMARADPLLNGGAGDFVGVDALRL